MPWPSETFGLPVAFLEATASAEDYFQRSDELHELSVQQEEEVVPDLVEQ